MRKPSPYYRTWFHWYLNKEGRWPDRWALIPVLSYMLVILVMDPIAWICQKLIVPDRIKEFAFSDERITVSLWRQKIFYALYLAFDFIRHHFVDRFAIRFVNGKAKWPPPESRLFSKEKDDG